MNVSVSLKRALLILGVLLTLWSVFRPVVVCAGSDYVSFTDPDASEKRHLNDTVTKINNEVHNAGYLIGDDLLTYNASSDGKTVDIGFETVKYNMLDDGSKQEVMSIVVEEIQTSGVGTVNRNKLYNFVEDHDKATVAVVRTLSNETDIDIATASTWYTWLNNKVPISAGLGFIVILTFALLTLSTVLDIVYITVPLWQLATEKVPKVKGKKERPIVCSYEAFVAVERAEEAGKDGKSPLGEYLHMKTKQFIVMAICILYLVSGKIWDLISGLVNLFGGFVG